VAKFISEKVDFAGSVPQVIEHLSRKYKTLSSNLSTTKKPVAFKRRSISGTKRDII
jgi:hypothetical protein